MVKFGFLFFGLCLIQVALIYGLNLVMAEAKKRQKTLGFIECAVILAVFIFIVITLTAID